MNPEAEPPTEPRLTGRWWFAWIIMVLLAAVTPYLHYQWSVAEIIEPLRGPQLLPAHWLIFRHLGEISGFLLLGVLAVGVVAWRDKPSMGRKAIVLAGAATLIFSVAYASYCGWLITSWIKSETHRAEMEDRKAEAKQATTEPTSTPESQK